MASWSPNWQQNKSDFVKNRPEQKKCIQNWKTLILQLYSLWNDSFFNGFFASKMHSVTFRSYSAVHRAEFGYWFLFLNMSQFNISFPLWQSKNMTADNGVFHLAPVQAVEYELQLP